MFRPFRRVDRRTDGEAPACECPRVKRDHRSDVLDVFPGELQRHHRVCGVAHLPETEGEPEAREAVLHSGNAKDKTRTGSLNCCRPAGQAGPGWGWGWGTARGCAAGLPGVRCAQERSVQGSSATGFLPRPLRTTIFRFFPRLIQEAYGVAGTRIDAGDLDRFYASASCRAYNLVRTKHAEHTVTAEYPIRPESP